MAGVDQNRAVWTSSWDWSEGGDEWSRWWGGTKAMWVGALLPRVHAFVPTGTILEIAPGYGRWTQFLRDLANRLIVVDLAENCIEHCRQRFAETSNIEYHVNDGRSLAVVGDRSVDFVFSFDSLVHAELDVLDAYLGEIAGKLTSEGVGFLHHSNAGAYRGLSRFTRRTPHRLRWQLVQRGVLLDLEAWRAESVTAERFAERCEHHGLTCFSQELISWERGYYLTDAVSLIALRGSRWDRPRQVSRNPWFRRDARRMSTLYAARE